MTVRELIDQLSALPEEQHSYIVTTLQSQSGQLSATNIYRTLHGGSVAPMDTIVIVGDGFYPFPQANRPR